MNKDAVLMISMDLFLGWLKLYTNINRTRRLSTISLSFTTHQHITTKAREREREKKEIKRAANYHYITVLTNQLFTFCNGNTPTYSYVYEKWLRAWAQKSNSLWPYWKHQGISSPVFFLSCFASNQLLIHLVAFFFHVYYFHFGLESVAFFHVHLEK